MINVARTKEELVVINSFGIKTGVEPPLLIDKDFPSALKDAIAAGIHVFFSAGNNHTMVQCTDDPCAPNTIWEHKSYSDVAVTAACDLNGDVWHYSSRGPGQYYGDLGTNQKPDVTAPTPKNGLIVYGNEAKVLRRGWGTSGACPQSAGLAALLLSDSDEGRLGSMDLFHLIRSTAVDLGHDADCQGAGMINCLAAFNKMRE